MRTGRHGILTVLVGALLSSAVVGASVITTAPAFADETPTTGVILPDTRVQPRIVMRGSATPSTIPTSVDLRQWAVPAGDQGNLDACVSWAIGYTMLGWYAKRLGTPTTFAPMYLYSQTHLDNSPSGGGSYVSDALNVTQTQGIATLANYQPQGNYNYTTSPTAAQRANAAAYVTTTLSQTLFAGSNGNFGTAAQTAIQTSLAGDTPVGLAIPLYANFYNLNAKNYTFTSADVTGASDGFHYLSVLGYDPGGVWVENSWGTSWGQNGFAYLTWDFVNRYAVEAESIGGFKATSLPTPTAVPTVTTPVTPRSLRASLTTTTLNLSWQASPGAKFYVITTQTGSRLRVYNTTKPSLRLTKLSPYTTYHIRVVASNTAGDSKAATQTFRTAASNPKVLSLKTSLNKRAHTVRATWRTQISNSGGLKTYVVKVKKGSKVVSTKTYRSTKTHSSTIHLPRHGAYTLTFTITTKAGKHVTSTRHITLR